LWQLPLAEIYGLDRLAKALPVTDSKRRLIRRTIFVLREVQTHLQYAIEQARDEGRSAELMGSAWRAWKELVSGQCFDLEEPLDSSHVYSEGDGASPEDGASAEFALSETLSDGSDVVVDEDEGLVIHRYGGDDGGLE
jgi:hypothetical protein